MDIVLNELILAMINIPLIPLLKSQVDATKRFQWIDKFYGSFINAGTFNDSIKIAEATK